MSTPQYGGFAYGTAQYPASSLWGIGGRGVELTRLREGPYRRDLSFEIPREQLAGWRQYDRAGDFEEVPRADGGVEIDSSGGITVDVSPPPDFSPPFDAISGIIAGYAEEQLSPTREQVSLTIRRLTPRDPAFAAEVQSGPFEFTTPRGQLGLTADAVSPAPTRGSTAGRTVDIELQLTPQQAALICDDFGTPGAIVQRAVDNGTDFYQDITGGDQTMTVTTPSAAALTSGEYGVLGWALEPLSEQRQSRWRVALELAPLD